MIALATLLAPVTQAQARASAVTKLVNYGIPANNWKAGGVFSTLLTVWCFLFASFTTVITSAINGIFLGTASGAWLSLLAYYVYGVTRQAATFGTTSYTLTNTGGGIYSLVPGQLVVQCPLNGNTFTNTTAVSLAAGSVGSPTTVTFTIQAQASGSLGGAPAGQITTLVTSVLTGVTGTNAAACIGLDAWTDATLVAACYAALAARSQKGPSGAYLAAIYGYSNVPGATNAVTGQPVNVNRVQVYTDPNTGFITVYLASPAGIADPNDVAGVQTAITAVARPMGITATAVSCTAVAYSPTITVWSASSGSETVSSIQSAALAAINTALAGYPIGGRAKPPGVTSYLYSSYVAGEVAAADPATYAVDLSPSSDTVLTVGQVATFTGTVVVRQVSP